ncbi:MAG TPA: hypothetical protein VFZ72_02020 [Jiangellaceae bacterium]
MPDVQSPSFRGFTGSLVDGVDHVYVPMADAKAAFAVLAEQLQLPVLWPFMSFGEFSSGGVSVGSIKLEIIEPTTAAPWCMSQEPPQIQGIAFRPARHIDEHYLADVDARSIARTEPALFERDGKLAWTNVYFSDFISQTAGAFVCDYYLPESRDLDRRRRVLEECGGGRLGVLDASELVVSTRDTEAARRRWQRLFGPGQPAEGLTWRPPIGPAITLMEGDDERVAHLSLTVRSVETAHRVWSQVAQHQLERFPLRFVAD